MFFKLFICNFSLLIQKVQNYRLFGRISKIYILGFIALQVEFEYPLHCE